MTSKINLNRFQSVNVAVIGDVMLDRYLNGNADRISPEAPIPVVNVKEIKNLPGGAANVMNNATGMGSRVWGFGVVGNDYEGKFLSKVLTESGINATNLIIDDKRPTTLKCRVMVGHHQLVRYDVEEQQNIDTKVEKKLSAGLDRIASLLDIIIISDYDKGMMTPSLVKSIMGIAKKYRIPVLVDPKIRNTFSYVGADYVKINLHNAEKVCGMSYNSLRGLEKLCKKLSGLLRCRNIIVTLGRDGLAFLNKDSIIRIPSLARDVYDVTGAGDVMTSILGIALSNGYDIKTACYLGNIGAAIKVGKVGTYCLSREELIDFIDSRTHMV